MCAVAIECKNIEITALRFPYIIYFSMNHIYDADFFCPLTPKHPILSDLKPILIWHNIWINSREQGRCVLESCYQNESSNHEPLFSQEP